MRNMKLILEGWRAISTLNEQEEQGIPADKVSDLRPTQNEADFLDGIIHKIAKHSSILDKDFLYHISEREDISLFEPRPFWFSDNGTTSGAWTGKEFGGRVERVVYASTSRWTPFYALPREMKRAAIPSEDIAEAIRIMPELEDLLIFGKDNLLIESSNIQSISGFNFTVYAFDKEIFKPMGDGEIEWSSNKAVEPISVIKIDDPIRFLEENNWKIVSVESIENIVDSLRAGGLFVSWEG